MIKVYDNLFAHDFLVETYKTCVKDIPWQYTNSANRSQYPTESVFSKGSHNFFGREFIIVTPNTILKIMRQKNYLMY